MKHLVQGAYTWEWIRMNEARAEIFDAKRLYIAPTGTRATDGHTYGALLHLSPDKPSDSFKIKRFTSHAHTKVGQTRRLKSFPALLSWRGLPEQHVYVEA